MMDQQESLKGTSDQKDNIYEDSDIEAIVHNIFSSKFQEVFSFSLHWVNLKAYLLAYLW